MTIYIHIPFCRSVCGYCDFERVVARGDVSPYIREICGQMRTAAGFGGGQRVSSIYFGGGTPSLLMPEALQQVIDCAGGIWDCTAVEEITVEANPDDLTDGWLARLAGTAVNRLSIGIQSFSDVELRFMGRRHDARQAIDAVRRARRWGIQNISIDLIYGLPHSTVLSWQASVNQAVALGVEHISAYHLSIEAGSDFARREIQSVGEAESEEQYRVLCETLAAAGFEHYEISNFARPGYRSRHNSAYWDGTPYLGVGAGAHSYDGERVRFSQRSETGDRGQETEVLGDEELYEEMVMLRLRTSDGLDVRRMQKRLGRDAVSRFEALAKPLVEQGLLLREGGCYRIPQSYWLVSDAVIGKLI